MGAAVMQFLADIGNTSQKQDVVRQSLATSRAAQQNEEATAAHTQAQIPLIQQQTEGARMDVAAKQRAIDDQKILSQVLQQAGGATAQGQPINWGSIGDAALKAGASPAVIQNLQLHQADLNKKIADAAKDEAAGKKDQLANLATQTDNVRGLLDGVIKAQDPGQQARGWFNLRKAAKGVIDEDLPEQYPGPVVANSILGMLGANSAHVEDALKQQQSEREAALAKEALAHAGELKTKTERDQFINDTMKKAMDDPQSGDALIDAALPSSVDPQANAAYKAARKAALGAGNIEGAAQIVATAATHGAGMSPAKQAYDVATDVKKETATAPIKIASAIQTELQKAKLAGGLGSIVDPQARNEASRQYDAAANEAANGFTDSQRLKQNIQLAMSGNKVAPNLETIEELRSIVNRVNATELKQVAHAGDAVDNIRGWLGGYTKGQPIPDNIQKDFLALADAQQSLAQQKLALKIGILNAKNKSNIPVPDIAGIYSNTGSSGAAAPPTATHRFNPTTGKIEAIK